MWQCTTCRRRARTASKATALLRSACVGTELPPQIFEQGHQLRFLRESGTGPVLTYCGACGHHGQVRFAGLGQACLKQRSKQLGCLKWLTQCRHPDPQNRGTLYTDVTREPPGRKLYRSLAVKQGPQTPMGQQGVEEAAAAGPGFDDAQADPISEDEVWLRPLVGCSRSTIQAGSMAAHLVLEA